MKVGQIAEKTGVSRDTVRLYEKLGLLGEVERPYEYNNYKEYGEENIYRIKMIKEMQRIGLTLKECKGVILALVNDEMDAETRLNFIKGKITDVEMKIKSLQGIQAFLQERIDTDCAFNSDSMIAKLKAN
ncbi:MAG: MerR family copper efflux transcriptional regulator [Salibacteraceae bacterium]|jgi:MerR family copper efflux transcriptional regulator